MSFLLHCELSMVIGVKFLECAVVTSWRLPRHAALFMAFRLHDSRSGGGHARVVVVDGRRGEGYFYTDHVTVWHRGPVTVRPLR